MVTGEAIWPVFFLYLFADVSSEILHASVQRPEKNLTRRWFQMFFMFTPNLGEMLPIDEHIFQMGGEKTTNQLRFIIILQSEKLSLKPKTKQVWFSGGFFGGESWDVNTKFVDSYIFDLLNVSNNKKRKRRKIG